MCEDNSIQGSSIVCKYEIVLIVCDDGRDTDGNRRAKSGYKCKISSSQYLNASRSSAHKLEKKTLALPARILGGKRRDNAYRYSMDWP